MEDLLSKSAKENLHIIYYIYAILHINYCKYFLIGGCSKSHVILYGLRSELQQSETHPLIGPQTQPKASWDC